MEACVLKSVPLKREILSVLVTARCQADCDHCLCKGQDIPELSPLDYPDISHAIEKLGIKRLRFTGGEPSLCVDPIRSLLSHVLSTYPDVKSELVTNGLFAQSRGGCERVFSAMPGLAAVSVSYDRFHAKYVERETVERLVDCCRRMGISISGFACISDPEDLCDMIDNEVALGIPFKYQPVVSVGGALKNNVAFKYSGFDKDVLDSRCPQTGSFIYIPKYGFTHCCSSLFFKSDEATRCRLADKNMSRFLESDFYLRITHSTFGEMAEAAGIKPTLEPGDSLVCELCNKIVPACLASNDNVDKVRCSA